MKIALWDAKRLFDFADRESAPLAKEINDYYLFGFGHDAINRMICIESRAKRMGVSVECEHCNGTGDESNHQENEWERIDPPVGEGYQVWETVSEGSPISPVFTCKDDLVDWLVTKGYSREASEKFFETGYAPSAMICDGVVIDGIEGLLENILGGK